MKCFIFLLVLGSALIAQAQVSNSTTVKATFGSTNTEMQELMGFLGVERHHIELDDPKLAGKFLHLTCQEYRNGVAQPEQDMFGFNRNRESLRFDSTGRLAFDVYARAIDPPTVESFFKLPRVGLHKTFKIDSSPAWQYSFRTDILAYKNGQTKIPINKKFPFLVHTLPYEKAGFYQYCALAQS